MSPMHVDKLVELLHESRYDPAKMSFLENGFRNGFDIGYIGPKVRSSTSENLPFTVGNKVVIWNKLMKEVKNKRVAGPFDQIPYENCIQSPIGLVPKGSEGNQTRLIFHLSYDCKRDGIESLNHFTPKELCTMKYRDLDYAVHAYLKVCEAAGGYTTSAQRKAGSGYFSRNQLERMWKDRFQDHRDAGKVVYASKTDIKCAFRILGLSPGSWRWLIMKAQDPRTGEWKYFVDKCLPFGASISCALFQKFSDALCHIFEHRTNTQGEVTNYLDNFLFLALSILGGNALVQSFIHLCTELKVPITQEKTEFATELVVFLRVLLDGRHFCLGIPIEKKEKAVKLLKTMLDRKKNYSEGLTGPMRVFELLGQGNFSRENLYSPHVCQI